jgi:hypothetical protein
MPVKRTASRLRHQATTARTMEGDRGILTRRHVAHSFVPESSSATQTLEQTIDTSLHHTPHTTDLAEGNANLSKVLAASIPVIISNSERATAPTASSTTSFTVMGQFMQQNAACLIGSSITRIIGQVQQIA